MFKKGLRNIGVKRCNENNKGEINDNKNSKDTQSKRSNNNSKKLKNKIMIEWQK